MWGSQPCLLEIVFIYNYNCNVKKYYYFVGNVIASAHKYKRHIPICR